MGSIGLEEPSQDLIQLPIINVSDTSPENGRRLVDAAIKYGFLYLSPNGTPFSESLIKSQFDLSKQFFAQPTSEKEKYKIGTDNRGFTGMHNEILDPLKDTKEFKEAFNMGEFDADRMPQQKMPAWLAVGENLEQLRIFEKACRTTCNQVLDLIGVGLEIEEGTDWFSRRHGQPSGCTVRLLHYPSLPAVCICHITKAASLIAFRTQIIRLTQMFEQGRTPTMAV